MTNKLENIKAEEIKLNEHGELELSEDLLDAISGGVSPEEADEEDINQGCGNTVNGTCGSNQQN